MNFFLILFGGLGLLLGALWLARRARERRIRSKTLARSGLAHPEQQTAAHVRIVWAEPMQILRLIDAGANLVVFRIIEDESSRRKAPVFRAEIAVTLEEFQTTVPWIPMASRLVVHRTGGIDAAMARQIVSQAHGRDVILLQGMMPAPVERRLEMAGDLCN